MLSLLPPSQRRASDPPGITSVDLASLLSIADPWRRCQLATEQAKHLETQITALLAVRRDAVGELVNQHRTPLSKVASHLGLTKSRIGQLAKAALRAIEGEGARSDQYAAAEVVA